MTISSHVLDTSRGRPAPGVPLILFCASAPEVWHELRRARTDDDGRATLWDRDAPLLKPGVHRIRFEVEPYFRARGVSAFYPFVDVVFELPRGEEHHHVPLLMSPFGYTTYRGS